MNGSFFWRMARAEQPFLGIKLAVLQAKSCMPTTRYLVSASFLVVYGVYSHVEEIEFCSSHLVWSSRSG